MSISHVSLGLTEGAWPRYSSDMKYKIQPIFKAKKYTETDNKILLVMSKEFSCSVTLLACILVASAEVRKFSIKYFLHFSIVLTLPKSDYVLTQKRHTKINSKEFVLHNTYLSFTAEVS